MTLIVACDNGFLEILQELLAYRNDDYVNELDGVSESNFCL